MRRAGQISALLAGLFWASAAPAQQPAPDAWTSIVPEGAMGNVIAMYMPSQNPALTVTMLCASDIPGLEIGVNDDLLRQMRPDIKPDDLIFFRAGGVLRQYVKLDEAQAWQRTEANKARWPGQIEFIAAIYTGQPLEILTTPAATPNTLTLLASIQGQPNDPGLAQIVAQCGDGRPAAGEVQAVPFLSEQDSWIGDWNLRPRGENFAVPVARVISRKNGSSLGLFCDGANKPAAFFSGAATTPGAQIIVNAKIGGQTFQFNAIEYNGQAVFAMTAAFLTALKQGSVAQVGVDGQFDVDYSLSGSSAGVAHAYANCGPVVY